MEDAFTAVPYLMEVQVCDSLDEVVPPRIAPQILNPASSSQHHPADSSGAGSSATHEGGGEAAAAGRAQPCRRGQQLDPASLVVPVGGPDGATETLHFFGVFDGHGGADAALHCAQTMHERVREALSSLTSAAAAATPAPSSSSRQQGGDGGAGASSGGAAAPRLASRATSEYVDAGSGELASTSSTSSFLECDLEPGGEAEGGGSRVEGAPCTTETVETALTKAFHLTGQSAGAFFLSSALLCRSPEEGAPALYWSFCWALCAALPFPAWIGRGTELLLSLPPTLDIPLFLPLFQTRSLATWAATSTWRWWAPPRWWPWWGRA